MSTCYSGGADGSDLAWGRAAIQCGHRVKHFSFNGHRSQQSGARYIILSDERLPRADKYLERANLTIKRRVPYGNRFVISLLRRNWWQVRKTQSVYAISKIVKGQVDGGTAWAVQMFIDRHGGKPCRCYVFDQITGHWYVWRGFWRLLFDGPPKPRGRWTGIGSRELLANGRGAIDTLMGG